VIYVFLLLYISVELVGRITNEVEAEKARKALERETRVALRETAGPAVTTRAVGIDANDLCEVHLHTRQKKRCTRKAYLFFLGFKICRDVACTSKFPAGNNEHAAAADKPKATCDVDGCDEECFDAFQGKAYCRMHINQQGQQQPQPTRARNKGGMRKGRNDESESDDSGNESSTSSSSAKSSESKLSKRKRPLSPLPQHQPQIKRRLGRDEKLQDCNASCDKEHQVLGRIRNNIEFVMNKLESRPAAVRTARRGATVCPFSDLLTECLVGWLTFPQYVKGMESIASRLNLGMDEKGNTPLETYVPVFVKNFIRWYTEEGAGVSVEEVVEGEKEVIDDNDEDLYWN
jgi:hypothetical protein